MHFLSSACCCWFFFLLFVRKGCFSSSDLLFIRHFVLFQFLTAVEAVSISLKTYKSVWAPAQTEGLGISILPIEDYPEYNSGQTLSTWREGFQAWVVLGCIQGMRNPSYPRDTWSFIQHLTAGVRSQAQSNYAWMSCRHSIWEPHGGKMQGSWVGDDEWMCKPQGVGLAHL